ncbi:hypothetical protein CLAIMM_07192 isoform 2, partial [Cladophialophora immunda]
SCVLCRSSSDQDKQRIHPSMATSGWHISRPQQAPLPVLNGRLSCILQPATAYAPASRFSNVGDFEVLDQPCHTTPSSPRAISLLPCDKRDDRADQSDRLHRISRMRPSKRSVIS